MEEVIKKLLGKPIEEISGGPFSDLRNASKVLLCLWRVCVDMDWNCVERTFTDSPEYYYSDTFEKDGVTYVAIPEGVPKPDNHFLDVYFPTKEDMKLVNFCKKLYEGDFQSANEALVDPWLSAK